MRFLKWMFIIFGGSFALFVIFALILDALMTDEEKAERDARWATRDSLKVVEQARADSLERARQIEEAPEKCARNLKIGNNRLEDQIVALMNNPGSYDFLNGTVTQDKNGNLLVQWNFTAKNAYGGRVRHMATAQVYDVLKCADEYAGTVLLKID